MSAPARKDTGEGELVYYADENAIMPLWGVVFAESAGKGKGSTFTVRLPLLVEAGADG